MKTKERRDARVRSSLGSYKVQQRQILQGGRAYHFVSYENPRLEPVTGAPVPPVPVERTATWFLMCSGQRMEVLPQIEDEEPEATDRRLIGWIKRQIT